MNRLNVYCYSDVVVYARRRSRNAKKCGGDENGGVGVGSGGRRDGPLDLEGRWSQDE